MARSQPRPRAAPGRAPSRARPGLALLAAGALLALGCSDGGGGARGLSGAEAALRTELGIPLAAEQVVITSQSSHLDLNFLFSFDAYYERDIRHVFRGALDLLDAHPRYRYSISEIAFLRRYWDDFPGERERLRRHAASGALRIVGGGLTSPDTVLPTGESLVRDWLRGVQWCRRELGVTPTAAWQPDSFGHSPNLPTILEHLGFDTVAFFRISGGANYPSYGEAVPEFLPGSTAEQLARLGTADYRWLADDGAEVLARWLPFGYSQGDDVGLASAAFTGLSTLGVDFNQPLFADAEAAPDHLQVHVDKLAGFSRTPYSFLPIGVDFSYPKPRLLEFLDAYNAERYPETGAWFHAGTLHDHADLLASRADGVPTLALDPNPYWTGFYTTQPQLKSRVRRAHESLTAAEKIATAAGTAGAPYPFEPLDVGWDFSAFMNHHDAITGTATAPVIEIDLDPWSRTTEAAGDEALAAALAGLARATDTAALAGGGDGAIVLFNPSGHPRREVVEVELDGPAAGAQVTDPGGQALPVQTLAGEAGAPARVLVETPALGPLGHLALGLETLATAGASPAPATPVTVAEPGGAIVLDNGLLRATLSRGNGGCLTSLRQVADGRELLAGPSNDVVTYHDDGGAYRIGSEIGRRFEEVAATCAEDATLEILERGPLRAAVRIVTGPADHRIERIVRLSAGTERLDLATTLRAPFRTSIVTRFRTTHAGDELTTTVPFGHVTRPRRALFEPTFWPGIAWIDLVDPADPTGAGLWLTAEGTRGWNAAPDGTVEAMLVRNTGWDLLGPNGQNFDVHTVRYAIGPRAGGGPVAGGVHRRGVEPFRSVRALVTDRHGGPLPTARSWVEVDDPAVEVVTLKRAFDRGPDLVLRLLHHGPPSSLPATVRVRTAFAGEALAADGLEDPGRPLGDAADFSLRFERRLATVRLVAPAP